MTHDSGKVMFVQNFTKPEGVMSHYIHLTLIEREKLLFFAGMGYSAGQISKELGRSRSTIYRELKRNSKKTTGYWPAEAQKRYEKRRKRCRRRKLLEQPALYELVKDKFLNHQWSPEQIAGRLALEGSPFRISYNTIYRAIYAGMFDSPKHRPIPHKKGMKRYLRHKGKPRKAKNRTDRRGKIPISHTIAERPKEANERSRIGDWEADTVAGKLGGACLITLVDRKSGYLLCKKASSHSSPLIADGMVELLKPVPHHTITPDRGPEFGRHEQVTKAIGGTQFYFALPHHPWQRGSNENTNGLLREYFPKSTNLANISDALIQAKVTELNLRPRKRFKYRTPFEVFSTNLLHLT